MHIIRYEPRPARATVSFHYRYHYEKCQTRHDDLQMVELASLVVVLVVVILLLTTYYLLSKDRGRASLTTTATAVNSHRCDYHS